MISIETTTPNGITYKQPTGLFINGSFVKALSGKKFASVCPTTEEVIVEVEEAGNDDVDVAVDAAVEAFPSWSETEPAQRARYLNKIADILEERADIFAAVESWDNGKTLSHSRGDVAQAVATFRNYAGWAGKNYGSVVETDKDHFNYIRREPVGACGLIIPWNFPLLMLAWKVAPCLATGCTFVLKTAESTPLSALLLCEVFQLVDLPKGVANVISAYGPAGGHLSRHSKISKVAFTGSTATGRRIMKAAADSNLKKITLELGGKSANIVFDDCDLDLAVKATLVAIFYNSGEVCSAGSRLYLQSGVYDKFLSLLRKDVENIKVGSPFDEDSFYGPQTSQLQYDRIMKYIESGVSEGATLLTGGKRQGEKGFFILPTIFTDVQSSHTIVREEIFGPVLAVLKFDTVEDAIELANDNEYGLAAGVHTQNLNRALYVANHLKAGTVWVNTYNDFHPEIPFGGFGASGIGRELGREVLENFTQVKSVRIGGISQGQV